DEIQQRKTDAEQLLMDYGFMQEVEKRAQEVISGMITAMGYKGYDILFSGSQEPVHLVTAPATDENQMPQPTDYSTASQEECLIEQ
ncbi:MAG: DUF4230 domain-containing protein, partial [Spirochaetaceae bacterium]|nr:DUF4230 domain-containing protein [Spirochaetaceae bacterium]